MMTAKLHSESQTNPYPTHNSISCTIFHASFHSLPFPKDFNLAKIILGESGLKRKDKAAFVSFGRGDAVVHACVLEVHLLDSSEGGPADGRHVCPPIDVCARHDAMGREPDGKKVKGCRTQAIPLTASAKRLARVDPN